jgi:hypothetical protein
MPSYSNEDARDREDQMLLSGSDQLHCRSMHHSQRFSFSHHEVGQGLRTVVLGRRT